MATEENRLYPDTAGKMLFRPKTQRKPPRHNQTLRLEFDSYFHFELSFAFPNQLRQLHLTDV